MEERKGITTYFGGMVRFVIVLALIILLGFFLVRFVQNRRATERAEQAVGTTIDEPANNNTEQERGSDENNPTDDQDDSSQGENDVADESERDDIPRGVAEVDQTPSTGPGAIPEAGISENILLSIVFLSTITFLLVKQRQYHNEIS